MSQYEPFEGEIARTQAESTPWWPTPPHPGESAPNVVVVVQTWSPFTRPWHAAGPAAATECR